MKVNPTWHRKKTRSPLTRAFLLLLVLFVTATLFWYNTKNRFEDITTQTAIVDTNKLLSKQERTAFTTLFGHFEKRYGFQIQLILDSTSSTHKNTPNTLTILLNNKDKNVTISFPSLLDRALSLDEEKTLKSELTNALQETLWINAILLVLEQFYFTLEDKKNA